MYERSRKPHADRLLKIVHNNKKKAVNTGSVITDDSLREKASERPNTILLHEHDVVVAFNRVLEEQKFYA